MYMYLRIFIAGAVCETEEDLFMLAHEHALRFTGKAGTRKVFSSLLEQILTLIYISKRARIS